MKYKEEIPEAVDPRGLAEISKAFHIRLWNLERVNSIDLALGDQIDHIIGIVKANVENGKYFIPGEDIDVITSDLKVVVVVCEQSNSKYNREKDKYGTRMKLSMITVFSYQTLYPLENNSKARMRVGSNGPPIHMFNTDTIFQYWVDNRHRLAEKQ